MSSQTLTFLGCGSLGTAILCGLLASLEGAGPSSATVDTNGIEVHNESSWKARGVEAPSRFIACVRSAKSAQRLKHELARFPSSARVTVLHGDNLQGVHSADSILLACQPKDLAACLSPPAIQKACRGKLLISILAGVTIPQIEAVLRRSHSITTLQDGQSAVDAAPPSPPATEPLPTTIVRAMPNSAAMVGASTTAITAPPSTPPSAVDFTASIFRTIGTVTRVPSPQFDICTALCGSSPAFFALFLESLLDGAVALGLKRSDAQIMAADTMKGTAMLILQGRYSPERVKETVATPGGSTIQGLLELERRALRATGADALIRSAGAATGLGDSDG
ncbi:MAG: hypothetical protein Q9195_006089 [Heterodermia aff. obscurata]